jgi:uncharacterized Zn finger protein
MEKQRQEEIIKALQGKGAVGSCPRCSNLQFEVIGEGMITIVPERTIAWGFPSSTRSSAVPVILVSCTNCGYIAQHAAGLLGLAR